MDALDDLGVVVEIIKGTMIEGRREILDDADMRSQLEEALERAKERELWKGRPFSRPAVNADLEQGRHLVLMHQQC